MVMPLSLQVLGVWSMIIYVNKLWDKGKTQLKAPGQTIERHSISRNFKNASIF